MRTYLTFHGKKLTTKRHFHLATNVEEHTDNRWAIIVVRVKIFVMKVVLIEK